MKEKGPVQNMRGRSKVVKWENSLEVTESINPKEKEKLSSVSRKRLQRFSDLS